MQSIPSVESILARLVRCPSVNPQRRAIWDATRGEAAMVDQLAQLLSIWADDITIQEVAPGRPNLIARFDGVDPSKGYALEAHTDTVGVGGMTIPPFDGQIVDGKLYGRGACDTKGPMAAMLHALIRSKAKLGRLPSTWYFVATCDEELGGQGAKHLIDSGFRVDGIVVAEPTEFKIIDAHKGVVRFLLTIKGRAAHSAYPEQGSHAVHAAGGFIACAEALNGELQAQWGMHPLGPPTLSVGTIHGGDQVNRIPDSVTMEIDCRILATKSADSVVQQIKNIADKAVGHDLGLSYELEQTQAYPGLDKKVSPTFDHIVRNLNRLSGAGIAQARYTTNAGFYSDAGIPAVVWGPGSILQAHTADEWIELNQVEQASDILVQLIETTQYEG